MSIATPRRGERPPGLDAATMTEAFQRTAQAHPDRCALRLKEDALSMTWREYADNVRRVAAGLVGLGLEREQALAIMLTNRPECPNPREVVAYLPEVRPTWFFAVPRIYEKLKAAMEAGIAAEQDDAKRQATQWALDVGLRKVRAEQAGEGVPEELAQEYAKADELVLSKIRARLGLDEIESINVGAAPTPREVIEFCHAIGIPLAELWGMFETCGYGALQPARADQDRDGWPGGARSRDEAGGRRRGRS
jgi:long-subunit acyl-CoA synthetase (AMP-forming)